MLPRLKGNAPPPFNGGWNGFALSLALWEQFAGVALGLGMMALCARKLNFSTPLFTWLSERSFAVYMLHAPILVVLALLFQPYRTSPYVMTPLLTLIGLAVSYGVADVARRVPGLRSVI